MDWSPPFDGEEYATFFREHGYAVAKEALDQERIEVLKGALE